VLNYLIFLGQVPGTNLQITFNELMITLDVAALLVVLERYHHLSQKVSYYWIYLHFYLIAKKYRQFRMPLLAGLIEHTN
jgi:hypothetical protein